MSSTPDIPSGPESSAHRVLHRVLHRVPHRGINATAALLPETVSSTLARRPLASGLKTSGAFAVEWYDGARAAPR
eukprot:CAMPEP_0184710832 /NCGR_PEP_ID=MMETSP0314-20130426/1567_1 /TAXON_ID=38298 /ORGANISM="Rhodella maculata, Strain CCMP 736" /LENGTH=74 /DNA_ID=CAMNT_0027172755 /DNA_START=252 /DNA_END=474 /DNA_ORIENTATION=+